MKHFVDFKENLVLDKGDWTIEEWKTLVGVFCGEEATPDEVITIRPDISHVNYFTNIEPLYWTVYYDITREKYAYNWETEPFAGMSCDYYSSIEQIKEDTLTVADFLLRTRNVPDGKYLVHQVISCNQEYFDSDEFVISYNNHEIEVLIDEM